jgi:sugar phosphate isomerase/epimerase
MELHIYKSLWAHDGSLAEAIAQAGDAGFQGIEGPPPDTAEARTAFRAALDGARLDYIAEVTTAGGYIPDGQASLHDHLQSLRHRLLSAAEMQARFVTCLGGCDAWSEDASVDFFGRAIEMAMGLGLRICFETHRGRPTFNPWATERIVTQLPDMRLTADYSHWCVVCERLLEDEQQTLRALAPRVHHIHARVGYAQGPQVPHPAAPEHAQALAAHQRWWAEIWSAQHARGYEVSTLTPEFGPDGYLQARPFTREPVAELWALNRWMAETERRHYGDWSAGASLAPSVGGSIGA